MSTIASATHANLALSENLTGTALNNSAGGSGTRNWGSFDSGISLQGDGAGKVKMTNAFGMNVARDPNHRIIRQRFNRNAGTSNFHAFIFAGTGGSGSAKRIGGLLGGAQFRLVEVSAAGVYTSRANVAVTAPTTGELLIVVDGTRFPTVTAQLFNTDGVTPVSTLLTYDFAGFEPGDGFGIGAFQDGTTGVIGDTIIDDGISGTAPVLTGGPTEAATGRYTGQGGASTTVGNGALYSTVTTNSTPLSALEMMGKPKQNVTGTGNQAVLFGGLTAGTQYWPQYFHLSATGARSNVRVGTPFTTASALPAPGITAVTVETPIGNAVSITANITGTVDSVTVVLPAAATPNGATTIGPVSMALIGGVWRALLELPDDGDWGFAVVTAVNADNTVNASATEGVSMISGTGAAPSSPIEPGDTAPVFLVQPASFAVTDGQAGEITWSAGGTAPITATLYTRANSGASWDAGTVVTSPHSTGNLALSENGRQHRIGLVNSVNPGAPVYSDVITVTVNAATPEPVQTEAYRIRMPATTYFDLFT